MKSYEYDIAISLCKQDVQFARKLIAQLNPSLKIFFYEDQQEMLITKSGPEMFAKVFKEKTRVVVVLSRDEWSESFYTEIEKNAIIDRTSVKNEGYHFLFMIPMEPSQVPSWYPTTRIYADPTRFSIEQLARFIEFKVTDQGGLIKQITLEDRHNQFIEKLENKKKLVQLQETQEAIEAGKKEIMLLKDLFNEKIETLQRPLWNSITHIIFSGIRQEAYVKISDFQLICEIYSPDVHGINVVTTQDFGIAFKLYHFLNKGSEMKLLSEYEGHFFYALQLKGWSESFIYDQPKQSEWSILYRNRNSTTRYDLKPPQSSEFLVDLWFQKLFKQASNRMDRYL